MTGTFWEYLSEVRERIRGQVALDVGSTVLGNGVAALAAFAGGAVLARWLGPEMRGAFELGLFIANSVVLALSLGLNLPVAVFATKSPPKGLWAYHLGLWVTGIAIGLGLALFGAVKALHLAMPLRLQLIGIGVVGVFAGLNLTQLTSALLVGVGRVQALNLAVVVRWTTYLLGVVLLSRVAGADAGLGLAWYGTSLVAGVLTGWRGLRGVDRSRRLWERGRRETKAVVWFGVRGQLSNVLQFASYRFDVLLVGLWAGTKALGVYAVGVMFAEALWILPNAVGTVLLSHTPRGSVEDADKRIRALFRTSLGAVAFGAVALGGVAILVTRFYLGAAYAKVPEVTWLLMPGAVTLSGAKILANELTARGFPGVNTVVAAIGAAATVGFDCWLIPRNGILGASVASSIGYSVSFLLTVWAFKRRTHLGLSLLEQ